MKAQQQRSPASSSSRELTASELELVSGGVTKSSSSTTSMRSVGASYTAFASLGAAEAGARGPRGPLPGGTVA